MSPARAALVTGASSGIGLELARMLAREGHALTIVGRRPDRLDRAAAELRGEGADVHPVAANLAVDDEVSRAVALHGERFGRLDVLVSSAGYGGPRGPLESADVKQIDRVLEVDLRSHILLTRECVPMLRQAGSEHRKALVVYVSSVAEYIGIESIAAYSAAKGGTAAFARAMQAELEHAGVQLTTLVPAYVDTPMSEWVDVPREEMLRPRDLAEGVRLLLRLSPACRIPELRFERRTGTP
jgi:NAD(P)-dependent dehydrogenase (short-subunit alcohol dehydrogenase family)